MQTKCLSYAVSSFVILIRFETIFIVVAMTYELIFRPTTELPFECPRCIRSFAAKTTLSRHLQRSHLVDTIIEMQTPHCGEAVTTTMATSSSTISEPVNSVTVDGQHNEMMQTDVGAEKMTEALGNGDGNGKSLNSLALIKSNSHFNYAQNTPTHNTNDNLKTLLFGDEQ